MDRTIESLRDEAIRATGLKVRVWEALHEQGMSREEIERDELYIEATANAERAQTRLWRARRGLDQ